MVFEALYKSKDIEAKPYEMMIYSIISSSVSLLIANMIFPNDASIVFLFLTTISVFPVIHRILQDQEVIDEMEFRSMSFLQRYGRTIEIYSYFFLGVIISVSFWASFLPQEKVDVLFRHQITTLKAIRGGVTGYAVHVNDFIDITKNNVQVAFIAFLLSFFFGTGAIFILSWNASIIGVFTSLMAKQLTSQGHNVFISHLSALLSISLHGIPEILGYFGAGIAGGVLSIAMIQGENKRIIILDSIKLFLLSLLLIVIAAFIESFITPIL